MRCSLKAPIEVTMKQSAEDNFIGVWNGKRAFGKVSGKGRG